jgi:hypothetical protein
MEDWMVIPRKWKVAAGAVSATMALGATAAIAEEGSPPADVSERPILSEVVDVSELAPSVLPAGDLLQVEPQDENASPFDNVSDQSVSTESESAASEESLPSEESEASESLPSEESEASESLPSEESVSADD